MLQSSTENSTINDILVLTTDLSVLNPIFDTVSYCVMFKNEAYVQPVVWTAQAKT